MKFTLYIDGYLELSPTVEEATWKANDFVKMLAKGGFTLTKLVSNVRGVLPTLNRIENPTNGNVKALAANEESSHVLGQKGIYRFDTLVLSHGTSPDRNRTVTQRVVFRPVPAVYDPFGLVALILLKPDCY